MPPLERAARALYRQGDTGPYGPEDEDEQWHQFVDDVRVVIAAIREPSEAMVEAAAEWSPLGAVAKEMFPAMIDALLEEGR